jgi:hypothetical protein
LGVVKSHEVSSFIGNLFFPLPAYHWGMLRGEASISIKRLQPTPYSLRFAALRSGFRARLSRSVKPPAAA